MLLYQQVLEQCYIFYKNSYGYIVHVIGYLILNKNIFKKTEYFSELQPWLRQSVLKTTII